jgi:hypothetical protein
MSTVASIVINIKGDNAHAKKSCKEAEGFIADLEKKANDASKAIQGILATTGITAGLEVLSKVQELGKQMLEFASSAIQSAHELHNLSNELGMTATSIAAFEKMASKFGASSEEARAGLQHFVRNLGELKEGSDEAEKKFAKFGITLESTWGQSNVEVMKSAALAILKIGSSAEQSAMAFELWGKSGQSMLTMIKQLPEGLDLTEDKLREMGTILGEEDTQQLVAMEASLHRITSILQTDMAKAIANLAPGIERMASVLGSAAAGLGKMIGGETKVPDVSGMPTDQARATLDETVKQLQSELSEKNEAIKKLQTQMEKDTRGADYFGEAPAKLQKMKQDAEGTAAALGAVTAAATMLATQQKDQDYSAELTQLQLKSKSLQEQLETWGMTANQIKVHKAELQETAMIAKATADYEKEIFAGGDTSGAKEKWEKQIDAIHQAAQASRDAANELDAMDMMQGFEKEAEKEIDEEERAQQKAFDKAIELHRKEMEEERKLWHQKFELAQRYRDEANPYDKWKKDAEEMANLVAGGFLKREDAMKALQHEMKSEAPKTLNSGIEYGTSQAAHFMAESRERQAQQEWAQQTAQSTLTAAEAAMKTNELLDGLPDALAEVLGTDETMGW